MVWPWGACRLPMGYVCIVREVRAACGGHGVHVDYPLAVWVLWRGYGLYVVAMGCVWTTYGFYVCCEGGMGCMWWPWSCGL